MSDGLNSLSILVALSWDVQAGDVNGIRLYLGEQRYLAITFRNIFLKDEPRIKDILTLELKSSEELFLKGNHPCS